MRGRSWMGCPTMTSRSRVPSRRSSSIEARPPIGAGHQQPGLRVGKDVRGLRRAQHRVDRHEDRSGRGRTHDRHDGLDPLVEPHRHAFQATDPDGHRGPGEGPDARGKFAIADRLAMGTERLRVGLTLGAVEQQGVDEF